MNTLRLIRDTLAWFVLGGIVLGLFLGLAMMSDRFQ